MVRAATVAEVNEYRLRIHFDGWDDIYDDWFESESLDLYPCGWCEKTGHPLETPLSKFMSTMVWGHFEFECETGFFLYRIARWDCFLDVYYHFVNCLIPNLEGLGTSPFNYGINNTRSTKSERKNRVWQHS